MKLVWILVLFLSSVKGGRHVTGFAGGGIIIRCKFNSTDGEKYFCKDAKKVNTCPYEKLSSKKDRRYSQYYNSSSATLNAHFTKLTQTDSGEYRCGTQNKNDQRIISLHVKKDDCCGQTISVCDHVGGNVEVNCTYPEEAANVSKHFCKLESKVSTCTDLIASKTNKTRGKFSIAHYRDLSLFTVTIREVTNRDSGNYWCGVRTDGIAGSMALITEVKLEVKGQLIIIVCVGAAVVVGTTVVFVYLKCWRFKSSSRATCSSTDSHRETGNKTAADCVYEEIKDPSSDPNPAESSSISSPPESVYALAQSPSQPSEDSSYSTSSDPNPAESSSISSPPESVYALAQSPSQPSEDPGYSTVNFHRNPDHQAEDDSTVTPKIDEVTSEYAVVK